MKFSQKLRDARQRVNLSTQDFADKLGVTRSYISLIENGKRLPSKKHLRKIAELVNIDFETIADWYLEEISHLIHK